MLSQLIFNRSALSFICAADSSPLMYKTLESFPYLETIPCAVCNKSVDFPIPGSPPDLLNPPVGCPFVDRCTKAMKVCKLYPPEVTTFSDTHQCACWLNQKEAMNK